MKIAIVIPVLNDWASLRVLLPQISTELHKTNASASVIICLLYTSDAADE